jgi:hypothetical protein
MYFSDFKSPLRERSPKGDKCVSRLCGHPKNPRQNHKIPEDNHAGDTKIISVKKLGISEV